MGKTPWIDFPNIEDRKAAKIRHFLMRLDRSFECEIHPEGLRFRFAERSFATIIAPELKEGVFSHFLLKMRVSRARRSNPVHFKPVE
jgi:hypothetical protein